MTDTDIVYLRDLDGTGSMQPCAKDDPGAVKFVRAVAGTEYLRGYQEAIQWASEQLAKPSPLRGRGKPICQNCGDPVADALHAAGFCGTCREMALIERQIP